MKKSTRRKIEKSIKKTHPLIISLVIGFLLVGIGLGLFTHDYLTKNDMFEVNGEKYIVLQVGDVYEYVEEGAKAVAYGKDITSEIKVEYVGFELNDNGKCVIDTTEPNEYCVIYTVDNYKYKNIQRIKYISVVEEEK